MIVRRSEAGTHCVLAIDAERRLVEEFREVPNSEVADLLKDMRARLGTNVRDARRHRPRYTLGTVHAYERRFAHGGLHGI